MKTQTNPEVANTIAAQIGRRAFQMMGTRYTLRDGNSLLFDVRGSKVKKITITLNALDTYDLKFMRWDRVTLQPVLLSEVEGVYADSLNTTIEHHTGLALSL